MGELEAVWAATLGCAEAAADHFWSLLDERCPGLVPYRQAGLFFTGLGRLTSGGDDAAGRAALLGVLGRAHRRYGMVPVHHFAVGEALLATVAKFGQTAWQPALAGRWERAYDRAARAVINSAALVGDGAAWWPAEVIAHERIGDSIAIVTVRPFWRLRHRPGQAIPVSSARRPGRWRWYSPANAPRADGLIEFHVRAVPGAGVSDLLVRTVSPGEQVWLGPPCGAGLVPDLRSRTEWLLIAGGTGLAPLRALVEQVAVHGGGRRVTLVVGARTLPELYDSITLDKLQTAHDWLTVIPAFSRDLRAEPAEWGDALTAAVPHLRPDQEVYVCGPPAMLAGARLRLLAEGVAAERIHLPDTFED